MRGPVNVPGVSVPEFNRRMALLDPEGEVAAAGGIPAYAAAMLEKSTVAVHTGADSPASTLGSDGDIYLVME